MERFPGYTLSSLLDEDAEILQLLKIRALGTPVMVDAEDWSQ